MLRFGFICSIRVISVAHLFVVLVILAMIAGLIALARRGRGTLWGELLDRSFIVFISAWWIAVNIWDLFPPRLSWDTSIPLHICDIVGLVAPFALFTRNRVLRSILYF